MLSNCTNGLFRHTCEEGGEGSIHITRCIVCYEGFLFSVFLFCCIWNGESAFVDQQGDATGCMHMIERHSLPIHLGGRYYHPHFTDEATKAQSGPAARSYHVALLKNYSFIHSFFLSSLHAHHGVQTHHLEIKSHKLYSLSQSGSPPPARWPLVWLLNGRMVAPVQISLSPEHSCYVSLALEVAHGGSGISYAIGSPILAYIRVTGLVGYERAFSFLPSPPAGSGSPKLDSHRSVNHDQMQSCALGCVLWLGFPSSGVGGGGKGGLGAL